MYTVVVKFPHEPDVTLEDVVDDGIAEGSGYRVFFLKDGRRFEYPTGEARFEMLPQEPRLVALTGGKEEGDTQ